MTDLSRINQRTQGAQEQQMTATDHGDDSLRDHLFKIADETETRGASVEETLDNIRAALHRRRFLIDLVYKLKAELATVQGQPR